MRPRVSEEREALTSGGKRPKLLVKKGERIFMKPFLAVVALFAVLGTYAQTTPVDDSMETQIRQRMATRPDQSLLTLKQEKPNEIKGDRVTYSGILVELAKTDRPWELINPAAPPEYGSSEDNVVRDPQSGREGLKLFSIQF
jgi:hypothetical protein